MSKIIPFKTRKDSGVLAAIDELRTLALEGKISALAYISLEGDDWTRGWAGLEGQDALRAVGAVTSLQQWMLTDVVED